MLLAGCFGWRVLFYGAKGQYPPTLDRSYEGAHGSIQIEWVGALNKQHDQT